MQSKLAQVRRLLAEGYELHEVESDDGVMEATFVRGTQRLTVRFLPSDAEALLLTRGPLFSR